MRYGIALAVAGILIGALAAYAWWDGQIMERAARRHLRQRQQEGTLPPPLRGVDLDTLNLSQYTVPVTEDVQIRQDAARMLAFFWYLWAPAVVGLCLVVAALRGGRRRAKT
jgi:hypothetical protein